MSGAAGFGALFHRADFAVFQPLFQLAEFGFDVPPDHHLRLRRFEIFCPFSFVNRPAGDLERFDEGCPGAQGFVKISPAKIGVVGFIAAAEGIAVISGRLFLVGQDVP